MADLVLKATRDRPQLMSCVIKTNISLVKRSTPGTKDFKEERQEALNSTVDCGSCYVGQHVVLSLITENVGMPAKFFIIAENDWFFQDIEVSNCSQTLLMFSKMK